MSSIEDAPSIAAPSVIAPNSEMEITVNADLFQRTIFTPLITEPQVSSFGGDLITSAHSIDLDISNSTSGAEIELAEVCGPYARITSHKKATNQPKAVGNRRKISSDLDKNDLDAWLNHLGLGS